MSQNVPPLAPSATDARLERITAQRSKLQNRHAQRLTALMEERNDLRGVHALADFVDDAVRWTA